jgi:hypothetical protein
MQFLKKLLVAVGIAGVSTSAMSGNDIASKASMAAQQAVETAKKVDGTVLDYSPNSLKSIDKIVLNLRRDGLKPEEIPGILFILGAYVGEVIVRHIPGAQWSEPPKEAQAGGLTVIGVTTKDGIFWNPVGKVHKLLMNGEVDSVSFFFEAVSAKHR